MDYKNAYVIQEDPETEERRYDHQDWADWEPYIDGDTLSLTMALSKIALSMLNIIKEKGRPNELQWIIKTNKNGDMMDAFGPLGYHPDPERPECDASIGWKAWYWKVEKGEGMKEIKGLSREDAFNYFDEIINGITSQYPDCTGWATVHWPLTKDDEKRIGAYITARNALYALGENEPPYQPPHSRKEEENRKRDAFWESERADIQRMKDKENENQQILKEIEEGKIKSMSYIDTLDMVKRPPHWKPAYCGESETLTGGPRDGGRVMALLDYFKGYSDAKLNQPDPCIHEWIMDGTIETVEQLNTVLVSAGLVERIKEAQHDKAKYIIGLALPKTMKGGGDSMK